MKATRRNPQHRADERAIFAAFLKAHSKFAASVGDWDQPDDEFPDVIVMLKDGNRIDFELAEWLYDKQMRIAKRREKLVAAMESAIGEQGENTSNYIRFVILEPKPAFLPFKLTDRRMFRDEIWGLIRETEDQWPQNPFWRWPEGHHVFDFTRYPTVGKYASMVWFLPWELGKERKGHVASQQWISASSHGGAYSPTAVLDKLMERLQAKIKHYGGLSRPVRLLVHYGKAVVYNTPWYGPSCRTFCDVAEAAAGTVANQSCFQMIYLLNAIEPGLEAYEIFPALMKCE